MRYILAVLVAAGAALAAEAAAQPASLATNADADQQPVFRSTSSELVVLPVTVTDERGHLVTDLPRKDFVVYDDGRRQDIAAFTNEDTPVSIALVIDDSGSMRNKIGEVV